MMMDCALYVGFPNSISQELLSEFKDAQSCLVLQRSLLQFLRSIGGRILLLGQFGLGSRSTVGLGRLLRSIGAAAVCLSSEGLFLLRFQASDLLLGFLDVLYTVRVSDAPGSPGEG